VYAEIAIRQHAKPISTGGCLGGVGGESSYPI
jgi:hypothetical protein